MKIRAVLFDMGNTLIDYDYRSPEEVFQRILDTLNVPRSLDDIKLAFLHAQNEARDTNLLSAFGGMEWNE